MFHVEHPFPVEIVGHRSLVIKANEPFPPLSQTTGTSDLRVFHVKHSTPRST
jgi:hypothetical protein